MIFFCPRAQAARPVSSASAAAPAGPGFLPRPTAERNCSPVNVPGRFGITWSNKVDFMPKCFSCAVSEAVSPCSPVGTVSDLLNKVMSFFMKFLTFSSLKSTDIAGKVGPSSVGL